MSEQEQQTTALAMRSMGDRAGNLMTVRELYDDIDRAYRFAKGLAIGTGGSERDAATAFGKIITGAELGIPPGAAVRGINFIKGRISMSADLMVGLAKEEGWTFEVEHSDPPGEWCKVTASKDDAPPYSFKWTMEMARQAGLTGGDNYKKYPWDMLYARAASHVARKVAPGRIHGMYAPEELGHSEREAFNPERVQQYQDAATDHLLTDAPESQQETGDNGEAEPAQEAEGVSE